MRINLSPSTGNKNLCFFAHMEKNMDPAAHLDALWEKQCNAPTETVKQMPTGGLQSHDKLGNPLI